MTRIAICDDQDDASDLLEKLLNRIIFNNNYDMEIVCVTDSQEEIFDLVAKEKIDVLFLDINFENSEHTGIEFANKLRKINKDFYLIFLTGYYEYALLSFKCKTFDFIVKPADVSKLSSTLERLHEDIYSEKNKLVQFKNNIILNENDIVYIEKSGYRAIIHTIDGKTHTTYGNIKELNNLLSDEFVQSHRSYIVNKKFIKSVDKKNNVIYFEEDFTCPVSDTFSNLLI